MEETLNGVITRLEDGTKILFTIWDAMDRGAFGPDTYAGAVFGAYDYLSRLVEELRREVEREAERPTS